MSDITRTGLASTVSSSDSVAGFSTDAITKTDRVTFDDVPASIQGANIEGVRMELVMRVRAQIAAGTYETPEKLEAAIDKMLGLES